MKHSARISTWVFGALVAIASSVAASPPQASAQAVVTATADAAVPDPAAQILARARMFGNNNVLGLARSLMPASEWQALVAAYDQARTEPASDADLAKSNQQLELLLAPGGVDRLMATIEPQLQAKAAELPAVIQMGLAALQVVALADSSDLSEAQRQSLKRALPAISDWATTTDFLSPRKLRQALTVVRDAILGSGIDNLDDVFAQPLEPMLARAGGVFAAAKEAVRLYGIDLDAVANSLRVEVLSINGDTARVRTTFTLLGAPVPMEYDMRLVDGRWYPEDSVVEVQVDVDASPSTSSHG